MAYDTSWTIAATMVPKHAGVPLKTAFGSR